MRQPSGSSTNLESTLLVAALELLQWLLLGFCSKIVGGGGNLRIVILLKKVLTMLGDGRTQNTTRW